MGDPCRQEGQISEIQTALRFFQTAEMRREGREERMARAMEKIAAQGETIKSHDLTLVRFEKSFENLFERVRILEVEESDAIVRHELLEQEKKALVLRMMESRVGIYFIAIVMFGFVIDIVKNFELLSWLLKLT